MSSGSYDPVAEKVFSDLEAAIKKDQTINEFYIVPLSEEENKNSSPILKGENTLGLESWIIAHIYPYAHRQILQKTNYRNQNLSKVLPCLTGVALLNPEMPTVWNKRRELIKANRLHIDDELRLTRMSLTRKPKCNDALAHRRWIITEMLKDVEDKSSLLAEELKLTEMIANRYHSNYHAWSHRMWSLQHLLPESSSRVASDRKRPCRKSFFQAIQSESANGRVTKAALHRLMDSEVALVYFEELDNNLKWVSSHVSDHSGLHFRTFLLTEVLTLIRDFLQGEETPPLETRRRDGGLIAATLETARTAANEYLTRPVASNEWTKSLDRYLARLNGGQDLTLYDVALCLVAAEFASNRSLCLTYPNHEALWSYRRFLVHGYRCVAAAMGSQPPRSRQDETAFLHQDQNGVPCRKDVRLDDGSETSESDLTAALNGALLANEEDFLAKMTESSDDHGRNLMRNYSQWLSNYVKGFD